MKSPPLSIKIFIKLDFFTNALAVWFVFVYTEIYWEQQLIAKKRSDILALTVAKMWIFKLISKNNDAIVILQFSTKGH